MWMELSEKQLAVGRLHVFRGLYRPDEFSEVELTNLNKEIGYEEKDDDILEEVTLAKKKKNRQLILNEL